MMTVYNRNKFVIKDNDGFCRKF